MIVFYEEEDPITLLLFFTIFLEDSDTFIDPLLAGYFFFTNINFKVGDFLPGFGEGDLLLDILFYFSCGFFCCGFF